mmetsp:Transcript_5859/g.13258  ORF Transcript_5859/g.13258 Transcript_5859/m.13258 type:complete len:226 (+) Transcript_5859:141-818(+)
MRSKNLPFASWSKHHASSPGSMQRPMSLGQATRRIQAPKPYPVTTAFSCKTPRIRPHSSVADLRTFAAWLTTRYRLGGRHETLPAGRPAAAAVVAGRFGPEATDGTTHCADAVWVFAHCAEELALATLSDACTVWPFSSVKPFPSEAAAPPSPAPSGLLASTSAWLLAPSPWPEASAAASSGLGNCGASRFICASFSWKGGGLFSTDIEWYSCGQWEVVTLLVKP